MPTSAELIGISAAEIDEVAEDQSVASMPSRYVEFLRVMGRTAGPLLVGTDAFYPDILGIKRDGLELLTDNSVSGFAPTSAIFFAMHQGYQVYWMPSSLSDDPPVYMYQEGDKGVTREWRSFTEFLRHELSKTA
ncbi:SMI1/KNR4 family protein [Krasilnikovia sp. MM14-A1004]|uniref:SMI1/KNR4 family protein n=1 Tax=Krasilnikovia sp. MM14-A1004 TaxID=3373541 RepID=UPI00399CB7E6